MVQEAGVRIIDINAGCPSRRVTNGGAGAALLSDLLLMERILKAVKEAVTIPVTLKFRSGPEYWELCHRRSRKDGRRQRYRRACFAC